jgi:hypothetical protein
MQRLLEGAEPALPARCPKDRPQARMRCNGVPPKRAAPGVGLVLQLEVRSVPLPSRAQVSLVETEEQLPEDLVRRITYLPLPKVTMNLEAAQLRVIEARPQDRADALTARVLVTKDPGES